MKAPKLDLLSELIAKHSHEEGLIETAIPDLFTYKVSEPQAKQFTFCDSFIVISSQGKQLCRVGDTLYDYSAGNYMTLFLPMSLEVQPISASPAELVLAVCIKVDLRRMSSLLLKMNTILPPPKSGSVRVTGIYTATIREKLLDPAIRLVQTLENPIDITMLSAAIIDEIYYRILCDDRVDEGSVHYLLNQQGQIQQIATAVHFIQSHLEEKISVDDLAELVNMSVSSFHRKFKEVMHVSPVKYAQSMKLLRAQVLIKEGLTANEAAHQVGYNSPAQFSREYKRQFGYTPAATVQNG